MRFGKVSYILILSGSEIELSSDGDDAPDDVEEESDFEE